MEPTDTAKDAVVAQVVDDGIVEQPVGTVAEVAPVEAHGPFSSQAETIPAVAFGLVVVFVVTVCGVGWRLWTKKVTAAAELARLLAAQAHELAVLQAAVTTALLELRELRARLEKVEKVEKKAAAFGDNFDVNANAHVDEAQGNLSKLQRTILDRKTTLFPIKK